MVVIIPRLHLFLGLNSIGLYQGQENPNLELLTPSGINVSELLGNNFQDNFPKTIAKFSVCLVSGRFCAGPIHFLDIHPELFGASPAFIHQLNVKSTFLAGLAQNSS